MIADLNRRMEAGRLTNVAVAKELGVTEGTIRFWRFRKRVPRNLLVREALERFLAGGGK